MSTAPETLIGKKVRKKSARPFKSTFRVNTVKAVIIHPILGEAAYTFEEDDSYVSVKRCEEVTK